MKWLNWKRILKTSKIFLFLLLCCLVTVPGYPLVTLDGEDKYAKGQYARDFLIEVQKGDVPGHSIVHKFGESTVGTTLQPVTESGFYRTPTVATALEFVSDDVNDTAAGSGAREITVIGLNSSWVEVTQTFATNGTTPVALVTDLIRLYRWYVSSSGTYADQSNGSHAGTLTIREAGAGQVWTTIDTTPLAKGQSQIGVYTIPVGKTGYIVSEHAVVDSNKDIDILAFRRDNADDVTVPYSGVMRMLNQFIGVAGDIPLVPRSPMSGLVGPCDVGFMAKVDTGTGAVSVDFEILLVDD